MKHWLPKRFAPVCVCVVSLGVCMAAPASAYDPVSDGPIGPEQTTIAAAYLYTMAVPNAVPAGVNDFSCKPSAAHPNPVILLEGTYATTYSSWAYYAPQLKKLGYCVFAPELPKDTASFWAYVPNANNTGALMDSTRQVAAFTDRVLASTGAEKVDMIGWSLGGTLARGYTKFFSGASKVGTIVSLGSPNHGTTVSGILTLAKLLHPQLVQVMGGTAGAQQGTDSAYITALNQGGETVPGVKYLAIGTSYDEVVTPWNTTFLTAGPGASVKNVRLQDGCEAMYTDHLGLSYNRRAFGYVKKALDPKDTSPLPCYMSVPVTN